MKNYVLVFMKKLNFAIIGCGRISYKHVEGLYENKDLANLAAILATNVVLPTPPF